jgi:hypothetical protein
VNWFLPHSPGDWRDHRGPRLVPLEDRRDVTAMAIAAVQVIFGVLVYFGQVK